MEKYQGKKHRLFLVDGDSDFRALLCSILEEEKDFEIVGSCGNGAEAVGQILATRPDIIITELILPDLDGLGLIRRINEKMGSARPAVVVLTAYSRGFLAGSAYKAPILMCFVCPLHYAAR